MSCIPGSSQEVMHEEATLLLAKKAAAKKWERDTWTARSAPRGSPRRAMSANALSAEEATLVAALHGGLSAEEGVRRGAEDLLSQWEACAGFATALLRLYARPPPSLQPAGRLLAVLCLKNAIGRRWHEREGACIADDEKAALRAGLLASLDETEPQLARQLRLVAAQVGAICHLLSSSASTT